MDNNKVTKIDLTNFFDDGVKDYYSAFDNEDCQHVVTVLPRESNGKRGFDIVYAKEVFVIGDDDFVLNENHDPAALKAYLKTLEKRKKLRLQELRMSDNQLYWFLSTYPQMDALVDGDDRKTIKLGFDWGSVSIHDCYDLYAVFGWMFELKQVEAIVWGGNLA